MNILEVLVKLKDDLKTWVTNNLLALKEEIEESKFSREYEDLFGKPDIEGKIENAIEPLENELNELNTKIGEEVESLNTNFSSHKDDNGIHVSQAEKHRWDSKADSNHGTHLELGTTSDTAFRGDYGYLAHMHAQSTHAPVNAQKNSDITKTEIEAKLTGNITTHTHSQYLTQHQSLNGYATETYVNNQITALVDSSPEAMNTLKELSSALKDDPNHTETMLTEIGKKANTADLHKVATSGSYDDLINKPTIPTADELLSDTQKNQISTAYTHSQTAHAPSNAQKNSDITKAEIEAKLTGSITTHNHNEQYYTKSELDNIIPRSITTAEIDSAFSAAGL